VVQPRSSDQAPGECSPTSQLLLRTPLLLAVPPSGQCDVLFSYGDSIGIIALIVESADLGPEFSKVVDDLCWGTRRASTLNERDEPNQCDRVP